MKEHVTSFSSEVTRRTWAKRDASGAVVASGQMKCWYGRRRDPGHPWRWVKLFTDKRASQRRWEDLRRTAELVQAGAVPADSGRLGEPLEALAKAYHEAMRTTRMDPDHVRISEWMFARLLELSGWKVWKDVTAEGLAAVLAKLDAQGATASYRNKFIARAKAFVNHFLPEGWASPLRRVKRIRERGARRTRGRRAAGPPAMLALFAVALPVGRHVAYALAALNGLRRNEARRLEWSDVHLDDVIPFMGLRRKMGADDTPDYVPLHPYVAMLLRTYRAKLGPERVLASVPDLKTLVKDWGRAGVEFKDGLGRRLDYHALRHTFQTDLDRTGCSRATKKKLMRHAGSDVTDGYAHAELSEMLAALVKLPSPAALPVAPAPARFRPTKVDAGAQDVTRAASNSCPAGRPLQIPLFDEMAEDHPTPSIGWLGACAAAAARSRALAKAETTSMTGIQGGPEVTKAIDTPLRGCVTIEQIDYSDNDWDGLG